MKITITLTEKDFLINQLFLISSQKDYKKKNTKKRFLFPVIFMLIGIFLLFFKLKTLAQGMLILSVIWLIVYPSYKRWFLKKFYMAFISKQYKDSFNVETHYTLAQKNIKIKNEHINMDIPFANIQNIVEIPSHFFLILEDESTVIFPKHQIDANFIDTLSSKTNTQIEQKLNWKW